MGCSGDETTFSPEDFSGQVRLFPLPNLVLFPHVIQPLHIFEPRYVDMLHAALESDRLIAMSLLKPGWEANYEGRPPIAPVACLARILTWQALPEQRYNVLLIGLHRVRIARELKPDRSFREAKAELLADCYPPSAAATRRALQAKLSESFQKLLPSIGDASEFVNQLSEGATSLGTLTDIISYALDLNVAAKQALLAECNVDTRAKRLLDHLADAACGHKKDSVGVCFPPAFSPN